MIGSARPIMASALPESPEPHEREERAEPADGTAGVFVRLGAFVLAFVLLSHLLLVHSRAFLQLCARLADRGADQALRIEATLRVLESGEVALIVAGSSIVLSHFDHERLAEALALEAEDVLAAPLFSGSGLDIAMMTRDLGRARPAAVLLPVTVWTLFDRLEAEELRVYDPVMALSILSARELLSERQAHASGLLGSLHFAIRHRASLRHMLWTSLGQGRPLGSVMERAGARLPRGRIRATARREQFTCPSVHTRALLEMVRRLEDQGVLLVLVTTPTNGRFDYDPAVRDRLDRCLAGLPVTPGLAVIPRSELPSFGPADFADPLHMNPHGRARFTAAVAPRLAVLLGRRKPPDALQ